MTARFEPAGQAAAELSAAPSLDAAQRSVPGINATSRRLQIAIRDPISLVPGSYHSRVLVAIVTPEDAKMGRVAY
jgi:hypothetical protein